MGLNLLGLGHYNPENEITNQFLEDLDIGTNDEWILERTGIRSRRTALSLDYIRETRNEDPRQAIEAAEISNAGMGARAAEMAMARAGVESSDVGLMFAGGCAPNTVSPAEACNIARELGVEAASLDINSACSSFIAGVYMLSLMDPDKVPDIVLLVTAEPMTGTVHYADRASAVLWGDGAIAGVLSTKHAGRASLVGQTLVSDPAGNNKVVVPRVGHFQQEGRTVQSFAIRKTSDLYLASTEKFREDDRNFHFVGHQANLRMLESVCRRCEIQDELHHSNCEDFGNTGGASSGSVISALWEKWGPEDDICVVGVGSGLTWGSYVMRFHDGQP